MFGFGNKSVKTKSSLTNHQKFDLAKRLSDMLAIQMVFAPTDPHSITKIEPTKGQINRKAVGYIYGFVDGALQSKGEDITNPALGVPVVYHVLRALFPGHEQEYMEFIMNNEDDELVLFGKMTGGQQYFDFIPKEGPPKAPMGMARFIAENQK
jgi:hypothetical protein